MYFIFLTYTFLEETRFSDVSHGTFHHPYLPPLYILPLVPTFYCTALQQLLIKRILLVKHHLDRSFIGNVFYSECNNTMQIFRSVRYLFAAASSGVRRRGV